MSRSRVPPFGWFALCLVGGLAAERWHPLPLRALPGAPRVLLGGAIFGGALCLGLWTLMLFVRRGTTPMPSGTPSTLLVTGPFRVSRNPLYAAGVLAHLALGLLADSGWTCMAAGALFLVLDRLVVPREEARLRALFGPAFERYARRVRRWG